MLIISIDWNSKFLQILEIRAHSLTHHKGHRDYPNCNHPNYREDPKYRDHPKYHGYPKYRGYLKYRYYPKVAINRNTFQLSLFFEFF